MGKYKILKKNKFIDSSFKVGDVVEGSPNYNGSIINIMGFSKGKRSLFGFSSSDGSIVEIATGESTPIKDSVSSVPIKSQNDSRILIISSSVGALVGLGFAYNKKSKPLGYVGYFFLGNLIGYLIGSLIGNIVKPKK